MEDYNKVFEKLSKYCEDNNFEGYDPFDGLNSIFFKSIPFIKKSTIGRLVWLQFF